MLATGRRGARQAAVTLVVTGCLVALAGCADGARIRAAQQSPLPLSGTWRAGLFIQGYGPQGLVPSPSGTPTSSAAPSASASGDAALTDPMQQTLAPLGLVAMDFPDGFRVDVVAEGTSLMQQTLAFCGKDYPSEDAREARRRTQLVNAEGATLGLLTEAVLYTTPKTAAAALAELRAATAACDPDVPLEGSGSPVSLTQTGTDGVDVRGFVPEQDRVLIASTLTSTATGAGSNFLTLYQVRGRVLVALYFQHPTGTAFSADEVQEFHLLGANIATRLNALDAAVVNGR